MKAVTKRRQLTLVNEIEPIPQVLLGWKSFIQRFDQLWQSFVCSAEADQEPKVTCVSDHWGQSYFKIYDPHTEKCYYFSSEEDALVWLDQSRHQLNEAKGQ